ncbi:MAG: DUF4384 domain-containing protein [Candidatus Bipolaricaulis sp.]|nr:DUF4384 domain-containing protein [Candidatus Bipolaricaulis sp.]
MRGGVRQTALLGIAFLVGLSFLAVAQSPLGLSPAPVEEPLAVQLWMDRPAYTEGDAFAIHFSVNRPSYIYLFDIGTDGKVQMLFPNGYSASNFASAGVHSLPEGLYQFLAEAPAGIQHVQIVASLSPLALPDPSSSDPYPLVGANPNEAVSLIQAQINALPAAATCGPQWVTAWCSFTVAAKTQATSCGCATPTPTPAPITSYCPPVSPTPPLAYPPMVSYYCPPTSPTPPVYYCPPVSPTPPLPQPPAYYNPCLPVQNPCPPVYNPCGLLMGFFFGFQIHVGP